MGVAEAEVEVEVEVGASVVEASSVALIARDTEVLVPLELATMEVELLRSEDVLVLEDETVVLVEFPRR